MPRHPPNALKSLDALITIVHHCLGHQLIQKMRTLFGFMSRPGLGRPGKRTTDLRKTYMCSICLPQSGQAPASHVSHSTDGCYSVVLHQPSGHASKSLHSRCQSARRTPNAGRRNWSYEVSTAICRNTQHLLKGWWSQTGSNRRPEACKATALPTELWPRLTQHHQKPAFQTNLNHGGPGKI